jgi:hypothetical protein
MFSPPPCMPALTHQRTTPPPARNQQSWSESDDRCSIRQ